MVTSKRCMAMIHQPGLETIVIANWPEHVAPGPLTNAHVDVLPTALDIFGSKASSPAEHLSLDLDSPAG